MQEKRYYYDNPLSAAWMAQQFGMIFTAKDYKDNLYDDKILCFISNYNEISFYWEETGNIPLYVKNYYIHPESLALLEPQEGDGGATRRIDGTWIYGNVISVIRKELSNGIAMCIVQWSCSNEDDILNIDECHTDRIYERNGTAFHWPKQERE